MEYMVLLAGWGLSSATLYLVYVLIKSHRSGGSVAPISATALIVALGFFTISTPKISSLILNWGANKLEVSQLEKKINEKKTLLAKLERDAVSYKDKNFGTDLFAKYAAAVKENPTGIVETPVGILVDSAVLKALAPSAKTVGKEQLLFLMKNSEGHAAGDGLLVNPATGERQSFKLTQGQKTELMKRLSTQTTK